LSVTKELLIIDGLTELYSATDILSTCGEYKLMIYQNLSVEAVTPSATSKMEPVVYLEKKWLYLPKSAIHV